MSEILFNHSYNNSFINSGTCSFICLILKKKKSSSTFSTKNKRIRMYSITVNRSQKQWQIHNQFQYFTFINESSSIILTMLIFYSKLKILLNNHQKKKKRKTFTLHIYITIISIKNQHVTVSQEEKKLLWCIIYIGKQILNSKKLQQESIKRRGNTRCIMD